MTKLFQAIVLTVLLTMGGVTQSAEDDLETGITAFEMQEYDKAVKLIKPLAEDGIAEAQYFMGTFYYLAAGVKQSDSLAQKWYKLAFDQWYTAAEDGDLDAMIEVSLMYHAGQGVQINEKNAEKWLQQAIEGGSSRAWSLKGDFCMEGVGTKPDKDQAKYWYQKAAAQGNKHAEEMLQRLKSKKRTECPIPLDLNGFI